MSAALTAASSAHAGVIFYNPGNDTTAWSGSNINSNCQVATSTAQQYAGTTSMFTKCTFNGSYNGRYHAMKTKSNIGGNGSTRWFGFAFYIPLNHDFLPESMWLFQTIADYGGSEGFKPNIWVKINDQKLTFTRQFGPVNSATKVETNLITNLAKGQWYEVVMKIHFDDDSSAKSEVWVNGTKELNQTGKNYFDSQTKNLRMDVGIYMTNWYQKDTLPDPDASPRAIYFDEIRVGDASSSFSEVDPGQNVGGDVNLINAGNFNANSGGWSNISRVHDGSTSSGAANSTANPAWLEYDFGANKTIKSARVNEDNAGNWHIGQWKIQYWTGSAWADAFNYTNANSAGWNEVNFTDRTTSKIRLFLTPPGTGRVEIIEFECIGN